MNKTISRRNFLKYLAGSAAAAVPASALLTSCKSGSASEPAGDAMTTRVNPNTGDGTVWVALVSILAMAASVSAAAFVLRKAYQK